MINRVVLVGRLTRDPELRKTVNGASVAAFTIAVDNRTKVLMEKRRQVLFHVLHGINKLKMLANTLTRVHLLV